MSVSVAQPGKSWVEAAVDVVRRLSAVTAAGGLLGLLVGGVGGRMAMSLLARLNPEVDGVLSDDGFTMGRLTGATFSLLLLGTLLGVVGAGIYFVLRDLVVGPRWFQVLSVSAGPAVVVGSQVVHTDGVDFTLDPLVLAVGLFVLIPAVYAALLTVLAERWLAPDGPFATSPLWLAGLPLLLWLPVAPLLGALAAGLTAYEAVRRTPRGAAALRHPAGPRLARGALVVVFAAGLVDLTRDVVVLA
jgi:hypothetical protein